MSDKVKGKDHEMDIFGDDEVELDAEELEGIVVDDADEDDEDEDVSVKDVVVSKPAKNQLALGGGLNLDFSGFGSLPGVVCGDIGLTVSRVPVERAKFTKDSRALIHIVTNKVVAIKTHYREGLGNYLCFGGECCEHDGLARVKYLFPIDVYDTNKKGKPVSAELQHRVLSVGSDQYEDIMTLQELNGDITGYDILVSCKDEQYQKLSFQLAGDARCANSPQWKESFKEGCKFWADNFKHIVKSSARVVTRTEFLKDLNENVGAQVTDEVDFDKVFDD
jgi:hypothetical protein